MKNVRTQIFQWIGAILVAALVMNVLLGFYGKTTGWIDRSKGATLAIFKPNSSITRSTEGRGTHRTDSRGYLNRVDKLADDYVLVVGASYTQGKEVKSGERYTDLLNEWLGYTDEAYVYNVSQDGYYFPNIVKGFTPLLCEFPDSEKIVIEIGTTYFSVKDLESALDQREYDEMQTGENIMSTLSAKKKLTMAVKEYCPLVYNISEQLKNIKAISKAEDKEAGKSNDEVDITEYEAALTKDIELMKSLYDGELIVLFHPVLSVVDGEGMVLNTHDTDAVFKRVCEENGVTFIDMSEDFLNAYAENNEVPYGFYNTTMGKGHFNKAGHRIMAEKLLQYLK